MNIAPAIIDLLYLHDCVIIPNFGGFLLNYTSASIHPVTHTFAPPSKTLAFNSNLVVNDGLLANHISRKSRISYDAALKEINAWVREMNAKLQQGESVKIEDAGSFVLNREGNMQFAPDESVNYYGNSFGLGTFSSPAIIRTRVTKDKSPAEPVIIPVTQRSRFRQLRRVAAIFLPVAIITGAVLVSLLNTNKNSDDKISYSGVLVSCNRGAATVENQEGNQSIHVEEVAADTTSMAENAPDTTVYVEKMELPQSPESTNQPPGKSFNDPSRSFHSKFKAPDTPEKRYYIIIGSFNTLKAAEQKVEELRINYYEDSFVVSTSKIGTYRVSAVSYFGFDKAKIQLETVKKQINADAWLLHM